MRERWTSSSVVFFVACATLAALNASALAQRTPPPIELNLGTTLASPPLSGGFFTCRVVNISSTDVLVALKVLDASGTNISILGDGSDPTFCKAIQQLPPNHACEMGGVSGVECPIIGPCGLGYCLITVVGNKNGIRGSFTDGDRVVEVH